MFHILFSPSKIIVNNQHLQYYLFNALYFFPDKITCNEGYSVSKLIKTYTSLVKLLVLHLNYSSLTHVH